MVRTFGAPVIEAQGKSAARISGTARWVRASTVEVICSTVGYRSTSNRRGVETDPGTATRPRSLRTMSTIIRFSARFLGDAPSQRHCAASASVVGPRTAVPFIGRAVSRSPSSEKNSSGDSEQIW